MDELVSFLRACLDEDERAARAATAGPWVWSREYVTPPGYHHRDIGPLEPGDAAHMARWDPARVLAEVRVKRALLEETIRPYLGADTTSGRVAAIALRLLALPYADRPDHREEWRP